MIKQLQQFKILDFPKNKKEKHNLFITQKGDLFDLSTWTDSELAELIDMDLYKIPQNLSKENFDFFFGLFSKQESKYAKFKFLIIKSETNDAEEEISTLLQDVLDDAFHIHLKGENIIFFSDKQNVSIQDFIDTISDDFGVNLRIFESPSVSKDSFFVVFQLVRDFLSFAEFGYFALKHLILEVYQHQSDKLKELRDVIKTCIDDTSSDELIKGLFKNNLNVSKTAKDVFMHRNTINNRLEQLQIKTTLNLQMFQDAMAMFILFTAK